MIHFKLKKFTDFTINELYNILEIRSEIFIVEQNCHYQDLDKKDQKAIHVLGYKNNELVAYARIFNIGDYYTKEASIGRVLVKKSERKFGYGIQYSKLTFIPGCIGLGIYFGALIGGKELNPALLVGSSALTGGGIAFLISSNKNKQRAIRAYNKSSQVSYNLIMNNNGIGVALTF